MLSMSISCGFSLTPVLTSTLAKANMVLLCKLLFEEGMKTSLASIMIKHGADVNLCFHAKDHFKENPQTIVHLAVKIRNHAIVKLLLVAGANIIMNPLQHHPVIIAACGSGEVRIVQMLLARAAEVNAPRKKRNGRVPDDEASPLRAAFAKGHQPAVRVLLAYSAEIEKQVETSRAPIRIAASTGYLAVVRLQIKAGVIANQNTPKTAFSIASSNGYLEVVQKLLAAGASIAKHAQMPNALAAACQGRHRTIMEILLKELSSTDKEEFACADALSATCASHGDEILKI